MTNYRELARRYAIKYGINPTYFIRQIKAESGFNPRAVSPAGARGIAQIMPGTAKGWGVDPMNPRAALDAAAKNMSRYLKSYKGDWRKALAAYNAGPGAVQKYGGVPPYAETRAYINKILAGGDPLNAAVKAGSVGLGPSTVQLPGIEATPFDKTGLVSSLFGEDEWFVDALRRKHEAAQAKLAGAGGEFAIPGQSQPQKGSGPGGAMTLKDYRDLMKLGSKFGLKIQGNFQTTGGKHEAGSNHYAGRAVDYGDANNKRSQFLALARYVKRRPHLFREFYYDPLGWYVKNGKIIKGRIGGHGDHLHIAV